MNKNIFNLLLTLFILIIFLILFNYRFEKFHINPYLRLWNIPTRILNQTRNMSYDLRCEPKIKKKNYHFMGSSIEPNIQHKCLKII